MYSCDRDRWDTVTGAGGVAKIDEYDPRVSANELLGVAPWRLSIVLARQP